MAIFPTTLHFKFELSNLQALNMPNCSLQDKVTPPLVFLVVARSKSSTINHLGRGLSAYRKKKRKRQPILQKKNKNKKKTTRMEEIRSPHFAAQVING